MEKVLLFARAEYDARVAAVKAEMVKRGIDLLVVSEPPNQNYLTGYDAYSFYTPQLVILAIKHPEPVFITRKMDRVSAYMTTYLADDNIRAYPDEYVNSTTLSVYEYMANVIKELGGESATIGVELGGYYYSARAHADLVRSLPQATFEDVDLLINWIRIVKSPAEVALMRQAGQIADAMIKRAVDTAAPGMRECDLAAAIYHQQISGTPEFGGSYDASVLHFGAGALALAPHPTWSDKPLAASTTIYMEVHGNRRRYQVHLARTIVLGKPAPAYQKLADVAVEAMNEALDIVRPGCTCSDVHSVFTQALARHGLKKDGRLGYPTGIGYPPAAAERTASLRKGDETVLQPGMCFHMMPGLWLDDVSVAITHSFVVTEHGHEPLTSTPRTLFIK
ncbi:MAG: M24 family metallopeptidase [Mesorhizobium sp.]|uniref:M24 family metallopeptidase n=1 Tax=unclassified Mesorhizobium TaxID=325217 RepID=UPI000FD47822|nr:MULTISPECIES: Xaa-Pro peptidase family protein [unclassified Mesorhizobium]RVD44684.1 M24 family metallopeptidase [Mesorhizobium sp. M4A.F.Ca.ET.020.02.1.1]RWC26141.1 MAG: M24 family metallopeptidase [Mesorhizobium sp.]RWC52071.1 MAG: M24 family metallopeptidase [Mesorhizobium sp.]RWD40698.1 MAG: M24 family metallopeptidase [Mesorhizobium sp.]TIL57931.1 MAG: M24 family metallopeptidase [Mesorhizobium sp.]